MPIYEYVCRNCQHKFERLSSLHDSDQEVECPKCGQKDAQKLMSASAALSGGQTGASESCSSCPMSSSGFG